MAAVAAVLPGYSGRKALRVGIDQHALLPGPNAGWSEAAVAGAIGRRLVGPIWLNGQLVTDRWLGDAADPPLETRGRLQAGEPLHRHIRNQRRGGSHSDVAAMTAASPRSVAAANRGLSTAAVYALVLFVRPRQVRPRSPPSCSTGSNRLSGRAVATGMSVCCASNRRLSMYRSARRGARLRGRQELAGTADHHVASRMHGAAQDRVGHDLRRIHRWHRLRLDIQVRARLLEERRVDAGRLDQRHRDRARLPPRAPCAASSVNARSACLAAQ